MALDEVNRARAALGKRSSTEPLVEAHQDEDAVDKPLQIPGHRVGDGAGLRTSFADGDRRHHEAVEPSHHDDDDENDGSSGETEQEQEDRQGAPHARLLLNYFSEPRSRQKNILLTK